MFTPFKCYQGLLRGKKRRKHVAHCCNATRIIHSRVLSREHRAELEFLRGIAAIINNYIPAGSNRMYHTCTCFWVLRTHSRALNFCGPQIAIRRVTAFNNYKGSLQMWYIDLIQQINKQVLHDFALSSTKIVPNKVTAEPLCISKSKFIFKTLMSTWIYEFNCTHASS